MGSHNVVTCTRCGKRGRMGRAMRVGFIRGSGVPVCADANACAHRVADNLRAKG